MTSKSVAGSANERSKDCAKCMPMKPLSHVFRRQGNWTLSLQPCTLQGGKDLAAKRAAAQASALGAVERRPQRPRSGGLE